MILLLFCYSNIPSTFVHYFTFSSIRNALCMLNYYVLLFLTCLAGFTELNIVGWG